jgi:hypothetical protein
MAIPTAGLTHTTSEMHLNRRVRDMRPMESAWKKTFRDKYGEHIADSMLLITGVRTTIFSRPSTRIWEDLKRESRSE